MRYPSLERLLAILSSVLDAHSALLFLPVNPVEISPSRFDSREARILRGASFYSGTQLADAEAYVINSAFSLSDNLDYKAVIRAGEGLVGWILKNKEPLLVQHFDQRRGHLGYYKNEEDEYIKAFMGCPLPGNWGALCVDCKRQYFFSEKDQKMLHLFADMAAGLVDNDRQDGRQSVINRYYSALKVIYSLRREHPRWLIFLQHLLELVAVASGYEYCVMCSCGADFESYAIEAESRPMFLKGEAQRYSMSTGVAGWVFRNNAPVFSQGTDGGNVPLIGSVHPPEPFQRIMALPLLMQRKTRGVLCLASSTPQPMPMDDELRDFARMVAEHLSLFLENLLVRSWLMEMSAGK